MFSFVQILYPPLKVISYLLEYVFGLIKKNNYKKKETDQKLHTHFKKSVLVT